MGDPAAGLGIQPEDEGHESSGGRDPGTSCTHVTRWGFFLRGLGLLAPTSIRGVMVVQMCTQILPPLPAAVIGEKYIWWVIPGEG